jgi:hypothetical protein
MKIYDLHYAAENLSWHVDQPAIQNNRARNDVPSRQHYAEPREQNQRPSPPPAASTPDNFSR